MASEERRPQLSPWLGPFLLAGVMIEIARIILWWCLNALLWGSELIGATLLLAWLYYVIVLEPRIRRKKQTNPAASSARPTDGTKKPGART